MKAVVCQEERLEVMDVPDPQPGQGQVLIGTSHAKILIDPKSHASRIGKRAYRGIAARSWPGRSR